MIWYDRNIDSDENMKLRKKFEKLPNITYINDFEKAANLINNSNKKFLIITCGGFVNA